jgi:hypothetical protein
VVLVILNVGRLSPDVPETSNLLFAIKLSLKVLTPAIVCAPVV